MNLSSVCNLVWPFLIETRSCAGSRRKIIGLARILEQWRSVLCRSCVSVKLVLDCPPPRLLLGGCLGLLVCGLNEGLVVLRFVLRVVLLLGQSIRGELLRFGRIFGRAFYVGALPCLLCDAAPDLSRLVHTAPCFRIHDRVSPHSREFFFVCVSACFFWGRGSKFKKNICLVAQVSRSCDETRFPASGKQLRVACFGLLSILNLFDTLFQLIRLV